MKPLGCGFIKYEQQWFVATGRNSPERLRSMKFMSVAKNTVEAQEEVQVTKHLLQ
jgi:hypothetical protein